MVTEFAVDGRGEFFCFGLAFIVDAQLMDHAHHGVVHSGDHVVFAGIVHLCKDVDDAVDVDGDAALVGIIGIDESADLIDDGTVDAPAEDRPEAAVHDVRTGAGDVEIRADQSGDEGCQAADLTSGAETEKMAGFLVFPDLFHVLRGKLHFCFVEVQGAVKIAGKDFFHNGGTSCSEDKTKCCG